MLALIPPIIPVLALIEPEVYNPAEEADTNVSEPLFNSKRKREWLSAFWRELPNPIYKTCGEDMHFSYMLQKYLNIKTYVPPHPHNDKEMWGSLKGSEYGGKNSLWGIGKPQHDLTNQYFKEQRLKGWKLVNEK